MNRHGDKQASKLHAHAVCKPGAVCDPASDPDLVVVPEADVPARSALAFGETEGVLSSLVRLVGQRDRHTAGHCERLASSGVALGVAMRLDSGSLRSLYVGGYLHDIGKVGIPDSILFKPGKLSGPEWEIMRAHPVLGEEICRPLQSPSGLLPLIRHHHERWDGSGYPDNLRGTEIPLLARVLQGVDIYDALTNPRPYKFERPRFGNPAGRDRSRMARQGNCFPVHPNSPTHVGRDCRCAGWRLRPDWDRRFAAQSAGSRNVLTGGGAPRSRRPHACRETSRARTERPRGHRWPAGQGTVEEDDKL